MQRIRTKGAPTPGAYSQGVIVDPLTHVLLFIAGQTGNDPAAAEEKVVEGGVGPQTAQTLRNVLAVVEAAGGTAEDIVALDVFLKDGAGAGPTDNVKGVAAQRRESREGYNAAYVAFFAEHGCTKDRGNLPARVQVWVSEVPWEWPTEDTVIEIRGIAAIPRDKLKK